MKILVTGANGFVGGHLFRYFSGLAGYDVVGAVRHGSAPELVSVGDVDHTTDWEPALAGCDAVIHCAGQSAVLAGNPDAEKACFATNDGGTRRLLACARNSGVRRFIHISTVKVHGEFSGTHEAVHEASGFNPADAYAKSKQAVEQFIQDEVSTWDMDVVTIRPPLIYGPGVKSNFLAMLKLANTGYPLPLGGLHGKRSMVSLFNLADFIDWCLRADEPVSGAFLVSDPEDLSVAELLRVMRHAMGRPARLLPVPVLCFEMFARILGKQDQVRKLTGSLVVSSAKAREQLGWVPPYSAEESVTRTVEHFLHTLLESRADDSVV